MIIGAYPSARFESRKSPTTGRRRLIPIADNLAPFAEERYFDGVQVRTLASGEGLREYFLNSPGLGRSKYWITDLVKVFLFKPEHADSCADVVPEFAVPVLRPQFMDLGAKSLPWIQEECTICQPKVVLTLGEEVARVITKSEARADILLSAVPVHPIALDGRVTFCCPHPDACRRSPKWRERAMEIAAAVRKLMRKTSAP